MTLVSKQQIFLKRLFLNISELSDNKSMTAEIYFPLLLLQNVKYQAKQVLRMP